jgi:tripeptide aminopeptidase
MIIRDHDAVHFAQREDYLRKVTAALQTEYGEECIQLEIIPTYRSMKEVINTVPWMMDNLIEAIESCGVEAKSLAFRGGTDGSALSQRGLPCPNLSAGYENAHGRFEYVPIRSMEKNVEILLKLAEIYTR